MVRSKLLPFVTRAYLTIIVLAFPTNLSFAQADFPLHPGDIWQYQSPDPMYPDRWEARITGDTVLPNGKQYASFTRTAFGSNYLRKDTSKVFAYDNIDSIEFLLFDFGANANDTISRRTNGGLTIILRGKTLDTATHPRSWVFGEFFGADSNSYDFVEWTITDSIGLTYLIGEPGNSWSLTGAKIDGVIIGTITGVSDRKTPVPGDVRLDQNFPNPFNPSTSISYRIPKQTHVRLQVYNPLGQLITTLVDEEKPPGGYSVAWDASTAPSGIYYFRISAGEYVQTKKAVLLK